MTEEASVWLQTRRILQRRATPRVRDIESSATPAEIEEWMHDEMRRWKIVDDMFRAQRGGR